MPFVCAATFRVKKKHLEEFNERVRKHANNCVTKERGCVSFEVSTDEKDPSRFMLYEVYVTKKDFDRHCKAAHVV
ncbi:MAG: hypothetical protein FJX56_12660, partial [Alphaproteobacteria bacterium]|nr:hypothetical protein [Alphaproteobacteria bacterium]